MEGDDPWDWKVDRVVQELCTTQRSWQPSRGKMPDAASLESSLREQDIEGSMLLVDVEDEQMKNDLGLKILSARVYLKNAIEELRQKSPQYYAWWQKHHPPNLASHYSQSLYQSPTVSGPRLRDPSTPTGQAVQALETLGSLWTPSLTHEGLTPPDDDSTGKQQPIQSDESASKRQKLDFTGSELPYEPMHDPNLVIPPDSTQTPVEVNGKKRKRIAPTLVTPILDPNRNREIPTNADDVVIFDPKNAEPGDVSPTSHEVLPTPDMVQHTPGEVFTDENGRKRMILVPEANIVSKQLPNDNNAGTTPQKTVKSTETFDIGYLGKKKLSADDIFYGETAIGEELGDASTSSDEISQGPHKISGGSRLYVQRRMRHFLRQQKRIFSRGEQQYSAVLPYPPRLAPRFHNPSFTLYSNNANPKREVVPAWPEIDPEVRFQKSGDPSAAPQLAGLDAVGSSADWDPECLERWRGLEGGDTVLPLYGESDEENEYDLQTWKEIEEERGELEKPNKPLKRPPITHAEVHEAIDQGIEDFVAQWKETRLPKLQLKAWKIWARSRKNLDKRHRIQETQQRLEHIKARIFALRKEIALNVWTSQDQVRKQVGIMQPSIFEREERAWEITILESKTRPAKPPAKSRLEPTPADKLVSADDGEDGESIDTGIEEQSSDDEGLEDFIVADELMSANEGEKELNLADGDDEDEDDDDDSSLTEISVPSTPTQKKLLLRLSRGPSSEEARNTDKDQSTGDEKPAITQNHAEGSKLSSTRTDEIVDLTQLSSENEVINLCTPEKGQTTTSDSGSDTKPFSNIKLNLNSASKSIREITTREDEEDDDESPQPAVKPRLRSFSTTDEDSLHEDNSQRKKRKKKVFEDARARDMRQHDRERVAEQEQRKKNLLAKLAETGGFGAIDRGRIIINEAKLENQGYIYVHEDIGRCIKPHQIEGVRFLWNQIVTDEKNMQGCLLAHTMGLGKTMQAITLLVAIAEAALGPDESVSTQVPEGLRVSKTLILCPPSLIDNWMDELLIWTPQGLLGDFRKIGAKVTDAETRLALISDWYHDGGVLILGYQMFRTFIGNEPRKATGTGTLTTEQHDQVKKHLLDGPNIIIADEAHKLKNSKAKLTTSAAKFRSRSRIALTGSPLANNVEEYYSMIEWVAPNYLGPIAEFRAKYVEPIQAGLYHDSTQGEKRKMLKMLEVLKEDLSPKVNRADMVVLRDDLPPKTEFVITVPLTKLQEKAYSIYVRAMTDDKKEITNNSLWHWLNVLTLLVNHPSCFKEKLGERQEQAAAKQAALHPRGEDQEDEVIWKSGASEGLVREEMALLDTANDITNIKHSNKVKILSQILDQSRTVGDKVLVFTSSIPTLDFLESLCKDAGRKYARLDGSTPMSQRQARTKDFNGGDTELYLISTLAGGLGLNLPGANRVVIFDFGFNPVAEEQAVGRAFRIGQQKPVFVYRFVAGGTFEEKVHNQAVFKKQLASRVVDKKNPMAWARKNAGDYLFEPKPVEKNDLSDFQGLDKVLDWILNRDLNRKEKRICAIVKTDAFEQHDDNKLTPEERREIKQLIKEEQLKRNNPPEYWKMVESRNRAMRQHQAKVAAQQAQFQQDQLRHSAARNTVIQNTEVQRQPGPPSSRGSTQDEAVIIDDDDTTENIQRPTPLTRTPKKPIEPILGGNTRIEQMQHGHETSIPITHSSPKNSSDQVHGTSTQGGKVMNHSERVDNTGASSKDQIPPTPQPSQPLQKRAEESVSTNANSSTVADNSSASSPQPKAHNRHEGGSTDKILSLPFKGSEFSSNPIPTSSPLPDGSTQESSEKTGSGQIASFDGAGDKTTFKSRLLQAMSKRPSRPVTALKIPVVAPKQPRRNQRRSSEERKLKAKRKEGDAKVQALVEKNRARKVAAVNASQSPTLPNWAHQNIEEAKAGIYRRSSSVSRGPPSSAGPK